MQDKKVEQVLNQSFSKCKTIFSNFRGRHNYLRVPLQRSHAYSYLDAYQSIDFIEFRLITLLLSGEAEPQVYKNKIEFQPPLKLQFSDVSNFQVSFHPHPTQDSLSLVHIHITTKDTKKKNKLFLFNLEEEAMRKEEGVNFQEIISNKQIIQGLWHPFIPDYLLILNQDCFELTIVRDYVEKLSSTRLKNLKCGERIVDFRFWPQAEGIRKLTVIGVGESGSLHLFICPILHQGDLGLNAAEQQIVDETQEFEVRTHVSLQSNFNNCCGIDLVSPPQQDFPLLFRRISSCSKGVWTHSLVISALMENKVEFIERSVLIVKGERGQPAFEVPPNCLVGGKFYFWCGEKLTVISLKNHISFLGQVQRNEPLPRHPSKQLQANTLFVVPVNHFKFVAIEHSTIKILRRAQTSHSYKFSSIPVEALSLEMEETKASNKVALVFKDIENVLKQLTQTRTQPPRSIKTALKFIKEQDGEKQLQDFKGNVQQYLNENISGLQEEKEELRELFEEAQQLSSKFESQKSKWRELDILVSKIEGNSAIICELEKDIKDERGFEGKLQGLKEMHNYLKARPLDIAPQVREQYYNTFHNQMNKLNQIQKTVQNIENSLKNSEF